MRYKLKEIFDLQMGKTPSRHNSEYWNTNDYKWISIADLSQAGKYISDTKEYISSSAVEESRIKVIPANTVVMSFKLSIGKTAITTEDMYSNEAIMAFHDKHVVEMLPEYIYYLFKYKNWDEGSNKAVMGKTLNKATLSEIEIEICPVSKQKEIVNVLDKITGILFSREKEARLLDELIKSRFVEMFGDPIVNSMHSPEELIGDSCFVTKLAGFEYTQYIHYEDSGDVVMVKAQNVKNGKLNRKDLSYISNEVSNSLPRSQLATGDIVMTYVGANIGDVAVIDDEYKYHLAPNVAKIRPDTEKYNSVYFMYMLMFLNSYIVGNSADTAKAALGMERIRKLKIFAPPIDLQKQFVSFVAQTDKSKLIIQKSLDELETLNKALMQKYFGGSGV